MQKGYFFEIAEFNSQNCVFQNDENDFLLKAAKSSEHGAKHEMDKIQGYF